MTARSAHGRRSRPSRSCHNARPPARIGRTCTCSRPRTMARPADRTDACSKRRRAGRYTRRRSLHLRSRAAKRTVCTDRRDPDRVVGRAPTHKYPDRRRSGDSSRPAGTGSGVARWPRPDRTGWCGHRCTPRCPARGRRGCRRSLGRRRRHCRRDHIADRSGSTGRSRCGSEAKVHRSPHHRHRRLRRRSDPTLRRIGRHPCRQAPRTAQGRRFDRYSSHRPRSRGDRGSRRIDR